MDNKKRILIVEDEKSMLQALSDTFDNSGFTVLRANNGEEGLRVALKEHPDILLIDLIMPKMDGMHMLQKVRADEWGKNAPAIFLTNVNPDNNEIISGIVSHQPAYYLVKAEVSLQDIVAKVKEVLKLSV